MKNFSQASENNKKPILDALSPVFHLVSDVFEVGSGSGQHAIHFSRQFPQLTWQPSELKECLSALEDNIDAYAPENVNPPVLLNVNQNSWPVGDVSMIFTTNTFHIMPFASVKAFFQGAGRILNGKGYLSIYGPFKYNNQFTTASNQAFDLWLKSRDGLSGLRDFEAIDALATEQHLSLVNDYSMPANNQLLLYQRS